MKWTILAVLALCLAGCAGQASWVKDGVAPQTAAADLADCNGQARDSTQRDASIDADILASRRLDWQNAGTLSAHEDMFSARTSQQSNDVVKTCMIAKGYVPGE